MPQVRFSLSTNKVGSESTTTIPWDDEEWDEMTDDEREEICKELFWDNILAQLGEWNWEVVE